MSEFEQKDYDEARRCADTFKTLADNILDIFNNLDATMKALYGESWQSSGADLSEGRYSELRINYEVFYQNVITMHDHIYSVTASNEEKDATVSKSITSV